ncbi:hypothetical protein [Asaia prunellae]|uniref:hypothetical protein n=1 Tax=Asaia prunellae TaxID=610245 RepID=UPI0011DCD7A3|nr:hypothetical protein [Asaia prunellae]
MEFRTRRAQIGALALAMDAAYPLVVAEMHILEAEARGATEQRRKDAEDGEPVAWMYRTRDGSHCVTRYIEEAELEGIEIFPLSYTRPANIAALEARVKELEGAKGRKQEEARRYRNALANIVAKTGSHSVAHRIALEALAAIREGGEHG